MQAGMVRKVALLPVLVALFSLFLGCTKTPHVIIHTSGDTEVRVPVELARTDDERRRGLMHRRDLDAAAGMLFLFPESSQQLFWMKNTPLPLDMIFINEDMRIVGMIENTVPFSTKSVGVEAPSRYVLEVNAGFAEQRGIKSGQKVEFQNIPLASRSP